MFTKEELIFIGNVFEQLSFKTNDIVGHVHAHNVLLKINKELKPEPSTEEIVENNERKNK